MEWKPAGYNSVSPYLVVENAEQTLSFVEKVFGGQRLRCFPKEDGKGTFHAEIKVDDTVLMMGDGGKPASPSHVHVYVPDAEATFAKAVEAGGKAFQPLQQSGGDDGDYRGGIDDGNGCIWWISTQKKKH